MPSTRYISKPNARQLLCVVALLLVFSVAFSPAFPAVKAFAASNESTTLGILATDSSASGGQGQGGSGTGTTKLGIFVTDSEKLAAEGYTITLSKNDGTGISETVEAVFNLPLPKVEPPTRAGYTFAGYYDDPADGKQYYKPNGGYTHVWDKAFDATLYAHWEASKYMVSFNQGGGKGGQTSLVQATFGSDMPTITSFPTKTGYTFAGYFDSKGKQYYDKDGKSKAKWDKDDNGATLVAHWTLQITCSFPNKALMQINAAGEVTGQDLALSSSTVEPIKITAIKGTPTTTAASLFAQSAIPDRLRILLTPKTGSGEEVKVPLDSADTSIPNGGWSLAAGSTSNPTTFAVAFSLFLPSGTQLNYFPEGEVAIANLSYVVEADTTQVS